MKKILGCIRRADKDFRMIESGDKIVLGISGGKDSLLLLRAMALYRRFCPDSFELHAVTVDMGFEGFDVSGIAALCKTLEIPYSVVKTDIGSVIFDIRKEKNPCSLCANMRRGSLSGQAINLGFNKIAYAHHREDVLETFLMSLFFEGRINTFQPVTYLSRTDLTVIRPMIYVPEKDIIHMKKQLALPVVKNPCPADGHTKRQTMKDFMNILCEHFPNAKEIMLSALKNKSRYKLWDVPMHKEDLLKSGSIDGTDTNILS